MLIDEEEVVIHKAMPASIKVEFDIDEENMEAVAEEGEEENETV